VDSSSVGLEKAKRLAESNGVSIENEVVDLTDFDVREERWEESYRNFVICRRLSG